MEIIKKKQVFIDTMILIYMLEAHPLYANKCITLLKDSLLVSASYLAKAETLTGYIRHNNQQKIIELEISEQLFEKIKYFPFGFHTSSIFAHLRNKYPNIKPPDCIHLATAIEHKADVFLTNDKQLKQVSELSVMLIQEL